MLTAALAAARRVLILSGQPRIMLGLRVKNKTWEKVSPIRTVFQPQLKRGREKALPCAALSTRPILAERRSFPENNDLAAQAGRKESQSVDPAHRSFSRDHALGSKAGAQAAKGLLFSSLKPRNGW